MQKDLKSRYLQAKSTAGLAAAKDVLVEGLEGATDKAWVAREIGMLSYWMDDDAQALHWLEASLGFSPRYPMAHYTIGHVLRRAGRLSEASAAYRAETDQFINNCAASYFLAVADAQRGEYASARLALKTAAGDADLASKLSDGRMGGPELVSAVRNAPEPPVERLCEFAIKQMGGSGEVLAHGVAAERIALLMNRRAMPARAMGFDVAAMRRLEAPGEDRYLLSLPGSIPYEARRFAGLLSLFALDNLSDDQLRSGLAEYRRVCRGHVLFYGRVTPDRGRTAEWWRKQVVEAGWRFQPLGSGFPIDRTRSVFGAVLEHQTSADRETRSRLGELLSDDPCLGWSDNSDYGTRYAAKLARIVREFLTPRGRSVYAVDRPVAFLPALSWHLPTTIDISTPDTDARRYLVERASTTLPKLGKAWSGYEDLGDIDSLVVDVQAGASGSDAVDGAISFTRRSACQSLIVILRCGATESATTQTSAFDLMNTVTEKADQTLQLRRIGGVERTGSRAAMATTDTLDEGKSHLVFLLEQGYDDLVFCFQRTPDLDALAALDWNAFRDAYGSPHRRPLLSRSEKGAIAALLTERFESDRTPDSFYKATLAQLAAGYGLLSDPKATAADVDARRTELGLLVQAGASLEPKPETLRWRMSVERLRAHLALHRADFAAAEQALKAIIEIPTASIAPHLLRAALDARFYLGALELAKSDIGAATDYWRDGVEAFVEIVDRVPSQPYKNEFEMSETANLFVTTWQTRRLLGHYAGKSGDGSGFPADVKIANASIPLGVDRYGDGVIARRHGIVTF